MFNNNEMQFYAKYMNTVVFLHQNVYHTIDSCAAGPTQPIIKKK